MRRDPHRDGRTPRGAAVVLCVASLLILVTIAPRYAAALDVFTLWSTPDLRLRLDAGDRVDYRLITQEQGRRGEDFVRLACLEADDDGWRLEVVSLAVREDRTLVPLRDERWEFVLDRAAADRAGRLQDHVREVSRWTAGRRERIDDATWREDPLLGSLLDDGFTADLHETAAATTRVVADRDLLCTGLRLASTDTSRIDLPRGALLQIHTRDVTVAHHDEVPFLGVAFAAERSEVRSEFVDPGRRRPPPPRLRIGTMELIDFENGDSTSEGGEG